MKNLDGIMLKQMIISGANHLFNCYPEIDALNVFPVPDGDTGTNMNLTMQSGEKEIQNRNDKSVYDIAKAFSKGLLMGARGNSGVILSQIFRGFALALEGKETIDAVDLAKAFKNGREIAYKAVMKPVEGTILTVIREASEVLEKKVNSKMDVEKAIDIFYQEAKESLQRTPDLLPVLKEVGVVDSGGAGLCKIIHGFKKALHGEVIVKSMVATAVESNQEEVVVSGKGYQVSLLLILPEESTDAGKKIFVEKRFHNVLLSHGSEVEFNRNKELVKVEMTTDNPGSILTYAQQFGDFASVNIVNLDKEISSVEFVEAKDEPLKEYAIIACAAGSGVCEKFKEYGCTEIVSGGQTMNPSTEDFVSAIKKAHAKKVLLLPNNSNIVLAASQACEVEIEGVESAKVIPTKTIPQGLVACMMFNPEGSIEDNVNEMTEAIENVKTGQVTYAIKDTSIDGVEVKKGQFIALHGKSIICCHPDKIKTTYKMIKEMIDEMTSIVTLICGEDVTESEAQGLVDLISARYPDIEVELTMGNQPVYSFIVGVE